ncbi:MAG: aminotransferase class [Caloramator sp.]|jgi:branched-subunit amino acid aminotransferase/4-amino-4-deoxychorismate lyase|uniref:aminotransferase class IV n=1 Tax=Caloramator sp. TaxID=1871330 RepID=UPI001DCCC4C3|nr:aminotransferase class IV [Caloramator sp.]MBZ4662882.1 aminotransferase class [Caloramator sp.]
MIDLFDRGVAFGLTPFETLFAYKGEVLFLDEHYKRLKRSLKILGIDNNLIFEKFKEEALNSIKGINNPVVIKIIYIDGKLHIKLRTPSYNKEHYDRGLKLAISRERKPKSILNYIKTFNYGQNYIEDLRAKNKGYDSCIFLDYRGFISEAAYGNLFFIKDRVVYTPSITCSILPGIIRKKLIEHFKLKGVEVVKTNITLDELENFDSAFFTNSVAGVLPVSKIGNTSFSKSATQVKCEIIQFMERYFSCWLGY